jgi:hypothetical protein
MLKDLLSTSSKEIENEFASTFISYDDPRLTQVATGYVIQAIFFFLPMVTLSVHSIPVDYSTPTGKKN